MRGSPMDERSCGARSANECFPRPSNAPRILLDRAQEKSVDRPPIRPRSATASPRWKPESMRCARSKVKSSQDRGRMTNFGPRARRVSRGGQPSKFGTYEPISINLSRSNDCGLNCPKFHRCYSTAFKARRFRFRPKIFGACSTCLAALLTTILFPQRMQSISPPTARCARTEIPPCGARGETQAQQSDRARANWSARQARERLQMPSLRSARTRANRFSQKKRRPLRRSAPRHARVETGDWLPRGVERDGRLRQPSSANALWWN